MYTYKTEILAVGTKWFSDKANANDIEVLDQLINEKAAAPFKASAFSCPRIFLDNIAKYGAYFLLKSAKTENLTYVEGNVIKE